MAIYRGGKLVGAGGDIAPTIFTDGVTLEGDGTENNRIRVKNAGINTVHLGESVQRRTYHPARSDRCNQFSYNPLSHNRVMCEGVHRTVKSQPLTNPKTALSHTFNFIRSFLMNRILITGDKGFVGSHIRAALESTYDVVAAVKPCLKDRPEGTSDLTTEYMSN